MATYTERLEEWPLPIGLLRPMTYVPISLKPTTRNIISRRTRPHDTRTAAQIALRKTWVFCSYQWARFTPDERAAWIVLKPRNFFADMLKRWTLLHAPAKLPDGSTDPSSITITAASATPSLRAIALGFTPSSATLLWGIVILRSTAEIVTPNPLTAIIFYPTKTANAVSYLDSPLLPGSYHYRAAAFESTGKLGPFSNDVFATVL